MRATLLALTAVLASCDEDPPVDFTPVAVAGVADHDLRVVLQEQWDIDEAWEEAWADEDPMPDVEALDARQVANVEAARAVAGDDLSAADRLTLDIYLERYGSLVATIPCDRMEGVVTPPPRARLLDAPRASRRARAQEDDDVPSTTPDCYRAYIRHHTTTDLAAEAIH
jgi:hypothetical protein